MYVSSNRMSPNKEEPSNRNDLDDPSPVPVEHHLIYHSHLAWKEGGRCKVNQIGYPEEYDSSIASNIQRRWTYYRKGTPGREINLN